MLDFSWGEIMVIGAVALVVIGPKDLPEVLRTVGRWTGAARKMAREFQGHVDEMIRESEVDSVRKSISENMAGNLEDLANTIDPDRTLRDNADPTKMLPDGGLGDMAAAAPPPLDPPPPPSGDDAGSAPTTAPATAPAATPAATPSTSADATPDPAAKPAIG